MITVAEASERILARIEPLPEESIATEKSVGRVLSQLVTAPFDSPPWDNSSMDGYAVRSSDLQRVPRTLRVVEEVAAGAFPTRTVSSGEAIRIMTGAPIPNGADTVIRREDTDDGRDIVTVTSLRDLKRNVRRRGEDFSAGDHLFDAGEEIRAAHAGALASAGLKSVNVHKCPRVAVISSGDELVDLSAFDDRIAGKKIVSTNSVTLPALIREAGGEPTDIGIARDDRDSVRDKLAQAVGFDLIITTAGISVGDHDHVRGAVSDLGGEIDFWKVRMRPGAPLAFGRIYGIPWIGLSGNPVSAMVTFELFVRPVIRKMLGQRRLFRQTIPVKVRQPVSLAAELMHFLRVVISRDEATNEYGAELAGSQSSSVMTAMARANALLILPGDRLEIEPGEVHRALPLGENIALSESLTLQ